MKALDHIVQDHERRFMRGQVYTRESRAPRYETVSVGIWDRGYVRVLDARHIVVHGLAARAPAKHEETMKRMLTEHDALHAWAARPYG